MKATKVNAGLAESNGRLLLGIWRDSLHVTCGLTACTQGSAPGPTLGNEYGKTLPLMFCFNEFAFTVQVKHKINSTQILGLILIRLYFTTGHFQKCVLCKECSLFPFKFLAQFSATVPFFMGIYPVPKNTSRYRWSITRTYNSSNTKQRTDQSAKT